MNTRIHKIALCVALMAGLGAALPASAQKITTLPGDEPTLAEQVKESLAKAGPFQDSDVDVAVSATNGVVHLTGWVSHGDDVAIAERIAAAVPGVKSVDAEFHIWSTSGRAANF